MIVLNVIDPINGRFQVPVDMVDGFIHGDDGTEKGMVLGQFDRNEVAFKLIYSDGETRKNGLHASFSESIEEVDFPFGFYDFYIQSKKWHRKRIERLKLDDFKCTRCGSEMNVQVHHLNYDRVGTEDVKNDLVTLCRKCHAEIHGKESKEEKDG